MGSTEVPLRRPAGASAATIAVLHFQVSYWTKWGQTVVVLGSWDEASKRGHRLACRHAGEGVLVWEARIPVPLSLSRISYNYAVVNDASEIEVEEGGARTVALPAALQDSAVIELQDVWQVDAPSLCSPSLSSRHWAAPCKATEALQQYNSTLQELLQALCKILGCEHSLCTRRTHPSPHPCCPGARSGATSWRTRAPCTMARCRGRSVRRGRLLCASGCGELHSLLQPGALHA
jgi:hypothetical protein